MGACDLLIRNGIGIHLLDVTFPGPSLPEASHMNVQEPRKVSHGPRNGICRFLFVLLSAIFSHFLRNSTLPPPPSEPQTKQSHFLHISWLKGIEHPTLCDRVSSGNPLPSNAPRSPRKFLRVLTCLSHRCLLWLGAYTPMKTKSAY